MTCLSLVAILVVISCGEMLLFGNTLILFTVYSFRAKDVDLVPYITTRLVDDFASHIRLYRRALNKLMEHRKDGMLQ